MVGPPRGVVVVVVAVAADGVAVVADAEVDVVVAVDVGGDGRRVEVAHARDDPIAVERDPRVHPGVIPAAVDPPRGDPDENVLLGGITLSEERSTRIPLAGIPPVRAPCAQHPVRDGATTATAATVVGGALRSIEVPDRDLPELVAGGVDPIRRVGVPEPDRRQRRPGTHHCLGVVETDRSEVIGDVPFQLVQGDVRVHRVGIVGPVTDLVEVRVLLDVVTVTVIVVAVVGIRLLLLAEPRFQKRGEIRSVPVRCLGDPHREVVVGSDAVSCRQHEPPRDQNGPAQGASVHQREVRVPIRIDVDGGFPADDLRTTITTG
mmetsp:Transcript_18775/g.43441  ORF Transcript_18775/g.43441 Transcript_18775/m.43441 type:complete len:319 (-) Transcript_18775:141-1097(-)